jgi:hypothetical protein
MNEFLLGMLAGGALMFITCVAWALWVMSPANGLDPLRDDHGLQVGDEHERTAV